MMHPQSLRLAFEWLPHLPFAFSDLIHVNYTVEMSLLVLHRKPNVQIVPQLD